MLPFLTYHKNMIRFDREREAVAVFDWRAYPYQSRYCECPDLETLGAALRQTGVHNKPALQQAVAAGLALAARQHHNWPTDAQRAALIQAAERLRATLPTDGEQQTALEIALQVADAALIRGEHPASALTNLYAELTARSDAAAEQCGRAAAELLHDGTAVLVHGFGGPAFNWMLHTACVEQGKQIHLYVTESRPMLEGMRLTAYEAHQMGLPVTLLTDNMPGLFFRRKTFTSFVAACRLLARDGSVAAHMGTYQYAQLAAYHQVPVYVLASEGPDPACASEADLRPGQCDPNEVLHFAGVRIAAEGVPASYPAFDVTPPHLITAIVTPRGIFHPADMATYDQP